MNLESLKPLAMRAWNGTSFSPERRGETFINEHEEQLTADLESIPEDRRAWYAQKYAKLCGDYLGSHSNVVSAMIAGPSNFPGARMNKRSKWADNKYKFFMEWRTRVLKAIERSERKKAREQFPEIDEQRKKLEGLKRNHEIMVACNKIIRSKKTTEAQKWEELQKLGLSGKAIPSILTPDYMNRIGFASYSLTNSNARIKHTEARVKELERRENATPVETEVSESGIRVVENAPVNRVQVFYPGKPSDEVRSSLKRNGFRWSPSNGCWQAYINQRTVEFAKQQTL